ncbi:MAG: anhydro-N-acetylmuramic acid kinase [Gammaproteobacteria bacterium]|nr:anhydro-N-acetylmuramic acid kinase [Gammaproteobacteria bacterium]
MSQTPELYIGLMSGTSVDALDVALVEIGAQTRLLAAHAHEIPDDLRAAVHGLCASGEREVERLGRLDRVLARLFAEGVQAILSKTGIPASAVRAIGSHGQTVRHHPDGPDGFTLQLGDANTLAVLTGIPVVADFRRKDIALGGQGAPLLPIFHNAMFRQAGAARAVVNIGGIANITVLPAEPTAPVFGYDTGPGNTLMDAWSERQRGMRLDEGGEWAASGKSDEGLVAAMLQDPYFARAFPKSTGRELFHLNWLDGHLARRDRELEAEDVQASLLQLTTRSIAAQVRQQIPVGGAAYLCGGGVHNRALILALRAALPGLDVQTTDMLGIGADWVEAMAFAWLAYRHCHGLPGNLPEVTGASRLAVLGGYYPV